MKTRTILTTASVIVALCLALPAWSADVAQGKCVSYDQANKTITIEEYDINFSKEYPYGKPTGKKPVFNVANALIGIKPTPGDVLRIAYNEKAGQKEAIRVMNVSKQDLMKQ
jgi:hypothetical protein